MKKVCTLLLVVLTATLFSCGQKQPIFISATDTAIHYTGRFDFTDKSKPAFMYSGCMISTGFTGTGISIKLQDDSLKNWFTVKLDDSIFIFRSNKKESVYQLAKNLADKNHNIEISRRTEWHAGNTIFHGFEIDNGKKLFPLPKLSRTIEFIGDSYTCGYGNEGKSTQEHFKYETENNYLTFGTIAARKLDAAYVSVCRSGIGMYQGYGGNKDFVQPRFYDEVIMNSKVVWDYKNNQPDVVVIALGGNDLSAPLDSAAFVDTYVHFLKKIRNQYPAAKIICVSWTEIVEGYNRYHTHVLAAAELFKKMDAETYFFQFSPFEPAGSDWHPTVQQHDQMATELVPFIKKIANW